MRERFKKYGPLIICIAVTVAVVALAAFSSAQTAAVSGGHSKAVVRNILKFLSIDYTEAMVSRYDHYLRKTAHFVLYFILGCSLTGISRRLCRKRAAAFVLAVLMGAALAALDEFHQKFVEGRGPMVSDVLLDTCGVAAGSLVMLLITYIIFKRKNP